MTERRMVSEQEPDECVDSEPSTLGGDLLCKPDTNKDLSRTATTTIVDQALEDLSPEIHAISFGTQQLMEVSSTSPDLMYEDGFRQRLAQATGGNPDRNYPLTQDQVDNLTGQERKDMANKLVKDGLASMKTRDTMGGVMALMQAAQLDPELVEGQRYERFKNFLGHAVMSPLIIDDKNIFPQN